MRAGIDRLSMRVQGLLALDPFSGHLFVFCNRKCDAIKFVVRLMEMRLNRREGVKKSIPHEPGMVGTFTTRICMFPDRIFHGRA